MDATAPARHVADAFRAAIATISRDVPVLVLCHNDADGLSAGALFARAFGAAGWQVRVRVVGRGESAWSDEMRAELACTPASGVVVTDLGVQPDLPLPGVPTVVVDHHVPGPRPRAPPSSPATAPTRSRPAVCSLTGAPGR